MVQYIQYSLQVEPADECENIHDLWTYNIFAEQYKNSQILLVIVMLLHEIAPLFTKTYMYM